MSPTWLRCCCLDGRSKRSDHKGNGQLDERFGDAAISGPMDGGWNQTDLASRTSPVEKSFHTTNSSLSSKSKKWGRRLFRSQSATAGSSSSPDLSSCGQQDSNSPLSAEEADNALPTATHEKPTVVYKPASDEFFRNMSELGRAKHSRVSSQPAVGQQQVWQREPSVRSADSMRPSSPADIPCHPSYQNRPLVADLEPGSTAPSKQIPTRPPVRTSMMNNPSVRDQRTLYGSEVPSPQLIDESGRDSDVEKGGFRPTTPQNAYRGGPSPLPMNSKRGKPKSKNRRMVTQEMVPSTNELFA